MHQKTWNIICQRNKPKGLKVVDEDQMAWLSINMMVNEHDSREALWNNGIIVNMSDSERLGGFGAWQTNRLTFAILEPLMGLKNPNKYQNPINKDLTMKSP